MPPVPAELEAAAPPLDRAREAALLVAEQLGLEHARRERRAVDAHERLLLARAVDVDGVRDQLLAGAGLAAQQHGRARRRDLLDLLQHLAQRGAVADDVAEVELAVELLVQVAGVLGELGREAAVLAVQVEPLDRVLQHAADLLRVPRLGDVAIDLAEVDRLDQHVDVGERGEDDADRVGLARAHLAQQLDAGHLRHALVGDDDRDLLAVEDAERLGATARGQDVERLAEVEPERVEVVLLVVDDQDGIALHVERHGLAQNNTPTCRKIGH